MTVKLPERLDAAKTFDIENTIKENLNGVEELTLDFENSNYISELFFRSLMSLNKIMHTQESMKLVNVCDDSMGVFEAIGLNVFFTFE